MEEKNTRGILKEHMIFQKTHTTSLADVRTLNMWGFELTDVSIVEKMPNVETISLSLNQITTLKPFGNCYSLKNLYLRQNQISDLSEINYLARLPNLRALMLRDNPVSELPNYRQYVAKTLPRLEKLDDIDISSSDASYNPGPMLNIPQNAFQQQQQPPQQQRNLQMNPPNSGRRINSSRMHNEERQETWQDPQIPPREIHNHHQNQPPPRQMQPRAMMAPGSADDAMLAAVLALIPELSDDSIQIVLDAIRNRHT
ncbi:Leucine Rich Repeat family protein [Trichomonas vaginalis G3]|uniref:Leucine Rich Repeat family protein n=2 Tax=Trichomonas vaginalis (strain ATCC PRA-98 / G3) TaxID=412133 RepID=A2GBB8_TRIV3|nr:uncharacterized protein TVAGG3_0286330 [Trichomonas vaginalis G3]EAX85549.1 Leucine Rich Repeat family protein [Trichomonas vaginalis G3]KAI5526925.1 DNA damage response, detection of DNA damage [Trichomonas vaginalis G3]|eukprot:XP_001298479.1 hypothetical protein [Trichomonas vaginalis G3]